VRLRSYLVITRNSVMASLAYRAHFFFMMIGTIVYIVVAYFLWKAIYAGGGTLGGLTFEQAYLYIGVSISLFAFMQTWIEWYMNQSITAGDLVRYLCKPLDYPLMLFFDNLGQVIINLVGIALPTLVATYFLSGAAFPGALNLAFFVLASLLGLVLNFFIDFLVGLTVFLTQSIWGISTAKEVTVLFLSGAVVPLALFPEPLRRVLEWLPFQAIYYTPVRLLIDPSLGPLDVLFFFGRQLAWLLLFFLLSRLFFLAALRRVVVNGG
jgi:ABC-2 type transport system permease protein